MTPNLKNRVSTLRSRHRVGNFVALLTFLCLVLGLSEVQAQADKSKWTRVATNSNVEVFYQVAQCNGLDMVFLRFINRNDSPVTFSWKERFDTQMENNVSGKNESKEILLPVGETSATGCEQSSPPGCRVAVQQMVPHYRASIKGYRLADVVVKKS